MGRSGVARQSANKAQRVDNDLCDVQCIDALKVTASRKSARSGEEVQTATDIFRVLGDPTRLRIVDALTRHELCVCDLALIVNASQSTVSHSLRALRQLRLVRYRKEGKIAFYSLDDHHIPALLRTAFEHAAES